MFCIFYINVSQTLVPTKMIHPMKIHFAHHMNRSLGWAMPEQGGRVCGPVQVGGHDHGWMEKEIVLMDWYSGWILGCLHMHVDLFATIYWDQLHGSKQCIQWYLDLPTTGNLKSKPKIWYLKACAYVYNTHINIRWYTIYDYIYIWYLHDIQYMVIYSLIYIYTNDHDDILYIHGTVYIYQNMWNIP